MLRKVALGLAALTLFMSGCTTPSLMWLPTSSSFFQPAPKVSREQAVAKAEAIVRKAPEGSAFQLGTVLLVTVAEVRARALPPEKDLIGLTAMLPQYEPAQRIWLITYKKGDPAKGPPFTLSYYVVEAETGAADWAGASGTEGPPP